MLAKDVLMYILLGGFRSAKTWTAMMLIVLIKLYFSVYQVIHHRLLLMTNPNVCQIELVYKGNDCAYTRTD